MTSFFPLSLAMLRLLLSISIRFLAYFSEFNCRHRDLCCTIQSLKYAGLSCQRLAQLQISIRPHRICDLGMHLIIGFRIFGSGLAWKFTVVDSMLCTEFAYRINQYRLDGSIKRWFFRATTYGAVFLSYAQGVRGLTVLIHHRYCVNSFRVRFILRITVERAIVRFITN